MMLYWYEYFVFISNWAKLLDLSFFLQNRYSITIAEYIVLELKGDSFIGRMKYVTWVELLAWHNVGLLICGPAQQNTKIDSGKYFFTKPILTCIISLQRNKFHFKTFFPSCFIKFIRYIIWIKLYKELLKFSWRRIWKSVSLILYFTKNNLTSNINSFLFLCIMFSAICTLWSGILMGSFLIF